MAPSTQQNVKSYKKETLSIDELLEKLRGRGLNINDEASAKTALTFIGYYRLSGYFIPYYKHTDDRIPELIEPKEFKENIYFQNILDLYDFDRKIRLIILEQIQRVEIGLRTCLSEHMSKKYGCHWFMNLTIFDNEYDYEGFFNQISSAKETFIQHYKEKYSHPKYPPSWMITETLSFGAWSKMYTDLLKEDKKAIAEYFNVKSVDVMQSWFRTLSHLRNLAAHHNRIWNRRFTAFNPKRINSYYEHMENSSTLYTRLVVLKYLSDQVTASDDLKTKLLNLMENPPISVSWDKMGFVEGWLESPLWQNVD